MKRCGQNAVVALIVGLRPSCSLLLLGASSTQVQYVAPVPEPLVACSGLGLVLFLSAQFLRNYDVGYSCPTDSSHIHNEGTVSPLLVYLPNRWSAAVIHAHSWSPPTLVSHAVFPALSLGCLLVPPMPACWMIHAANMAAVVDHRGKTMGSHRAGVVCTLIRWQAWPSILPSRSLLPMCRQLWE